jgi:hypothetical protein
MALAICLLLYFVPPAAGIICGPSFEMYGRKWLFNLCWLLFWPILMLFLPSTYR